MTSVNEREFDKMAEDFPFVIEGRAEPDNAERIFEAMAHLETRDLLRCREVSASWRSAIDAHSGLWGRFSLFRAVEENRLDIAKLIVTHSDDKKPGKLYGWTPLHVFASRGHTDISRLMYMVGS